MSSRSSSRKCRNRLRREVAPHPFGRREVAWAPGEIEARVGVARHERVVAAGGALVAEPPASGQRVPAAPAEFDPRKYLAKTVSAMRDICIARYEAFGTAGNASKIKPISLEGMFQRYASGELDPKIR